MPRSEAEIRALRPGLYLPTWCIKLDGSKTWEVTKFRRRWSNDKATLYDLISLLEEQGLLEAGFDLAHVFKEARNRRARGCL
jgi:hypothetical protein